MPELPEVETFRRYFDATSLHREIDDVQVKETSILSGIASSDLKKVAIGHHFEMSRRVGKYLFGGLNGGWWVVFHFGMTGSLRYFSQPKNEPEYTRVRFDFSNGYHLAYTDVRKLGMVGLTGDIGTFTQEKNLGPDALDLRYEQFQKILSGKRGSVKSILMNQGILSGIGNIYSDEILFQAGIYPKGRIEKMEEKSIHTLYDTIKEVLETAIEVRADVDNLPRTYLIPHREKGGICPKCGHTLTPIRVVGRTAYYCPEHQRV